jgi:Domain of unknown function (DUF4394)/Calx-beta domain/Domain of unknown function (DUF4214)
LRLYHLPRVPTPFQHYYHPQQSGLRAIIQQKLEIEVGVLLMNYSSSLMGRLVSWVILLLAGTVTWFALPDTLRARLDPTAHAGTFTVTNANLDGLGSLRNAIEVSNQNPGSGPNLINFNIPGSGVHVIDVGDGLPLVTAPVIIDGTTQPGFAGTPIIELRGHTVAPESPRPSLSTNPRGGMLEISGGNSTVRGLLINRYGGPSIVLHTNGGNLVQGNYIGADGPLAIAIVADSSNNTIGGTTAAARNVIMRSNFSAVMLFGNNNVVQGNFIGTDATGTTRQGNSVGIDIYGSNNVVGGAAVEAGNVISANYEGILIHANGNVIERNRIGTDVTGTANLGNGLYGIDITNGNDNLIRYNLISGNDCGVSLSDGSQATTLVGNLIGVSANATLPIANRIGVQIFGDHNIIGPPVNISADENVIAGNTTEGLVIYGNNNLVRANLIGNSAFTALKNGGDGVLIFGSLNTIGGNSYSTANVISGNGDNGIQILGATAAGNVITANRIGIDGSSSLRSMPNLGHGILIADAANFNTIGGINTPLSLLHNFIAYNKGDGVRVDRGVNNKLLGNYIHDNVGNGVSVNESGVLIDNNFLIQGNRIFDNGGRAIDLAPAGVTPNDVGDADTGPNGLQNFPVLTAATAASGIAFITGTLSSKPNATYRIEFFSANTCDSSGNGEATNFLGFTSVATDGTGNASFQFLSSFANDPALPGQVATAVASDPQGNTSELSACVSVQDGGFFSLTKSRTRLLETTPSVSVTVQRLGTAIGATSVDYATVDGSAKAGTDFTAVTGTLNFAANETEKSISIPIINDSLPEGIEIFKINLSNPQGGPGLLNRNQDIIIDDDEIPSGIVYALTADNHLLSFNSSRPDAIFENRLIVGEKLVRIDFRPATGQLYALGENGHLYTVNLGNFTLTRVGTSTLPNFGGFDFHPPRDRIRIANELRNMEVDPTTGADVGGGNALAFSFGDPNFGMPPRILALAHTNNVAGATTTTTYGLHWTNPFSTTHLVTLGTLNGSPGSPGLGLLFTVGQTGAATYSHAGFDISDTGEAFASLTNPEAGTVATFYKVNLATGLMESLGTLIDPNLQGITDIAVQPAEKVGFKLSPFSVNENAGSVTVTVTRTSVGGFTGLNYTTSDGTATAGADYQAVSGELLFQPGEQSKTFQVPILDDGQMEGVESVNLTLTIFASGSGGLSGTTTTGKIAIMDEPTEAGTTPIDNADFFVRQHYSDFLNRQPDSGGLAFWTNQITSCFNNQTCINDRRVGTSAAFFIENEFQQTGFYIYRFYQVALGRRPTYAEFINDRGQVVGGANLEAGKQAFATEFVQRQMFLDKYPLSMDGPTYVDAFIASANAAPGVEDLDFSFLRTDLLARYNEGANLTDSRIRAARALVDYSALRLRLYNPAFVLMQYFGYLRRPPDQNGYNFWLDHLNNRIPYNFRAMVCGFITSHEYQRRFSNIVTRSNQDCGP